MSKLVKNLMTDELAARYRDCDSAIWLEFHSVDALTTNDFRRELRQQDVKLEVVKNSMFRRAIGDGPLAPLAKRLTGPVAIVTGGESLIDAAKLIDNWTDKIKTMRFKGAVLEGEFLDEADAQALHKMPTKRELQGKLVAIVLSPGAKIAGAALAPGRNIAGAIKAMIQKLEDGEEIQKQSA